MGHGTLYLLIWVFRFLDQGTSKARWRAAFLTFERVQVWWQQHRLLGTSPPSKLRGIGPPWA